MGRLKEIASFLFVLANVWLAVATNSTVATSAFAKSRWGAMLLAQWPTWYFITLVVGLILLLIGIRRQRSRLRELLKHVLDTAVEHDMPDGQYDDEQCKATLFRYSRFSVHSSLRHWLCWGRWAWPWTGWLIPYIRSGVGHIRFWDATVFRAPKRTNGNYHGVAGAVWAKGFYSVASQEPPADKRKLVGYNKRLQEEMFLTEEEFSKRKSAGRTLSQYIHGSRLELSAGKRWGVLVFDSPQPPRDSRDDAQSRSDVLVLGILSRTIEWGAR